MALTTGTKKYKSRMRKKKKKHDKIKFLPRTKINTIEVLISKDLINSYISHDEVVLVNNLLREYDNIKKQSKIIIIDKYVWYNKRNINLRKKITNYYLLRMK